MTLERRLNARLTRKEHAEICEEHSSAIEKKVDGILEELRKQRDASVEHRQWVGDSLGTIRTQVALIRDRMGDNPFNDTGTPTAFNRKPRGGG